MKNVEWWNGECYDPGGQAGADRVRNGPRYKAEPADREEYNSVIPFRGKNISP